MPPVKGSARGLPRSDRHTTATLSSPGHRRVSGRSPPASSPRLCSSVDHGELRLVVKGAQPLGRIGRKSDVCGEERLARLATDPDWKTQRSPQRSREWIPVLPPVERVLLSEFSAWHVALNPGYLALTEEEQASCEQTLETLGPYPELPMECRETVERSWETIFDLDALGASPVWYGGDQGLWANPEEHEVRPTCYNCITKCDHHPQHSGLEGRGGAWRRQSLLPSSGTAEPPERSERHRRSRCS